MLNALKAEKSKLSPDQQTNQPANIPTDRQMHLQSSDGAKNEDSYRPTFEEMILLLSLFYLCWITVGRQVHCKNSIILSAPLMKVYSAAGLPVPLKYRQDCCFFPFRCKSPTCAEKSFYTVPVVLLLSNKGRTKITVGSSLQMELIL